MFGQVHGPYLGKDGLRRVIIVHHSDEGKIIYRKTLTYRQYMQEYDQGLHRYEKYKKPIKACGDRRYILGSFKLEKIFYTKTCVMCCKQYTRIKDIESSKCCSKSCAQKYSRKVKRNVTLFYHSQIVVPIKGDDKKRYWIIYEKTPGNKDCLFIDTSKCVVELSADENGVDRYRLSYNRQDAVRIKPVVGYKKYFWITESGALVSKRTKKILSQSHTKTGYLSHATRIGGKNGSLKTFRIHRLVATAFISNPENKPEVNHINSIRDDNRVNNLEWATPLENTRHSIEFGFATRNYAENHKWSIFTNNQVRAIRKFFNENPNVISIWNFCKIMDLSYGTVKDILEYRTYAIVL